MMEAVRTSETSVDNHFTRQYNPEDSSEHQSVTYYGDRRIVDHGWNSRLRPNWNENLETQR
jgi:hypothetical protein